MTHETAQSVRGNFGTFAKGFFGGLIGCLGAGVLLVGAFWMIGLVVDPHAARRCEIRNGADEPVDLSLWVSGKSYSVTALAPGESLAFDFKAAGGAEEGYTVKATFPSGKGFLTEVGYVDINGYHDILVLRRSGVEIDGELRDYAPLPRPARTEYGSWKSNPTESAVGSAGAPAAPDGT